jgi:4-hydroxybenzoyl-CoA thioesterase
VTVTKEIASRAAAVDASGRPPHPGYTRGVTDASSPFAVTGVHGYRTSVRFGDCDPAGIMYFPRLFELFHEAMESWFTDGLGLDYGDLILSRRIGFPAVHSEADFRAPCVLGDALVVLLRAGRVGRASIHLDYVVAGAHDPERDVRATGRTVCVVMDLDPKDPSPRRAISVPEDVRTAIERFRSRT